MKKILLSFLLLFSFPLFAYEDGIRIAWDFRTGKFVSNGVYSRVKRLQTGELALVYSDGPGVYIRKSSDNGATWGNQVLVASQSGYGFTNSDLIQLNNGWLLYAWNGRPNTDGGSLPYTIKIKFSKDNGATWVNEQLIYNADVWYYNGCWEPSLLQLPSGEIQLFFSNENPFRTNSDQEIEVVKSFDNGASWTAPSTTSYRVGGRDGMPVPVLLQNGMLAYSIEDPGYNGTFKPVIITSTLQNDWNETVGGNSPNRWGALRSDVALAASVYAGAPYLIQLPTGETLISCQSDAGRASGNNAMMQVYIGDANAKNFARQSAPFPYLAASGSAQWNAMLALDAQTVMATSSVNTGGAGKDGLWTINGRVLSPLVSYLGNITLDGRALGNEWSTPSCAFAGAYSRTNATLKTAYDAQNLYVYVEVEDEKLWTDSDVQWEDDGIEIYLDPQNKSCSGVCDGMYKFLFNIGSKTLISKGNSTSGWVDWSPSGVQYSFQLKGTKNNNLDTDQGYSVEIAIPWNQLGGKPALNTGWGIHFKLHDDVDGGVAEVHEDLSGNDPNRASTYLRIDLKPESNGQGLTGQYFRGMQFDAKQFTQIDPQVQFNWGTGSPRKELAVDSFSIRWLGYVQPVFSEDYTFYMTSDNGRRVWIGDSLVIDQWLNNWDIEYSGVIHLEAGKKYPIRVDYFEAVGGANIVLSWSNKSQAKTVVPFSSLYVQDSLLRFPYYKVAQIPGKIEAENFDLGRNGLSYLDLDATNQGSHFRTDEAVDVEPCTDTNGGYDVGWILPKEWMEYSVDVQKAGTYTFRFRVASGATGGTVSVSAGNDPIGTLNIPGTGGWQTWATYSKDMVLAKGSQKLRLSFAGNTNSLFNLNWVDIQPAIATSVEMDDQGKKTQVEVFPNPASSLLIVRTDQVTVNAVQLFNTQGLCVYKAEEDFIGEKIIDIHSLAKGLYYVKTLSNGIEKVEKIVFQ
jgi:hypothetical protein